MNNEYIESRLFYNPNYIDDIINGANRAIKDLDSLGMYRIMWVLQDLQEYFEDKKDELEALQEYYKNEIYNRKNYDSTMCKIRSYIIRLRSYIDAKDWIENLTS